MLTNQDIVLAQQQLIRNGQDTNLLTFMFWKFYHYKQMAEASNNLIISFRILSTTYSWCADAQKGDSLSCLFCTGDTHYLFLETLYPADCLRTLAILPLCQTLFPIQQACTRTTLPRDRSDSSHSLVLFLHKVTTLHFLLSTVVASTPEVHFPQRLAQLRGKTFSGVIALH